MKDLMKELERVQRETVQEGVPPPVGVWDE